MCDCVYFLLCGMVINVQFLLFFSHFFFLRPFYSFQFSCEKTIHLELLSFSPRLVFNQEQSKFDLSSKIVTQKGKRKCSFPFTRKLGTTQCYFLVFSAFLFFLFLTLQRCCCGKVNESTLKSDIHTYIYVFIFERKQSHHSLC